MATDTLNHQNKTPPASAGKTRLCLSRFQPARHPSVKDNILLPLVPFPDQSKMMSKVDSVSRELGIHQLLENTTYENLWWTKTTGSRSTGHHHLT